MGRSLVSIVLLVGASAGCDVVYGLTGRDAAIDAMEAPIDGDPCPSDRDCDLVLDPVDNCPDVANSDQDDRDDDDIGDRCDSCLAAPSTADEDSDTKLDNADNCPTVANVDQSDADGDGVGNACEPNPDASDAITCFFGFGNVEEARRLWSLAEPWSIQASLLVHFPATMPPFTAAPSPSGMLTAGDGYELRTTTQFSAVTGTAFQIGIGIGEPELADPGVRCLYDGTYQVSGTVTLLDTNDTVLQQASTPGFVNGQQQITFRAVRQGPTTMLTCSVADGANAPTSITVNGPPLADSATPRLISTNAHTVFLALTTYRLGP